MKSNDGVGEEYQPYCKPRRNSSKLWKFKQPTLGAMKK